MLDYNQTKQLIDFASKADTFPKVEDFMQNTFQIPKGPQAIGTYKTALEQHAQLLTGKDPATLQRLLGFLTKRALTDSPLKNKLTPEQQKELQVASLLSTILSDTHRTSDLQNMSGPKLLEMIRNKEVTYADVDAALEKVGKVQILDWLGDKLAADDLKKPVESLLSKIMAESDDRKAKPSNDVIDEVQPLKWKKAPHGQSAPVNLPMNPDAKSPSAPMDGMPAESLLAKILASEEMEAALKSGTKVKIGGGSGVDSDKTGVIVDKSEVKTDGKGVPSNIPGAYKPVDWSKEVAIRLDDGTLITMFKNRVVEAAVDSTLAKILAEFPPNDSDSKPASSEHDQENLDTLKEAFNRFISEEMAEGDEHDQESLEALKDSFSKFLDEEMKEA